MAVSADDLRLAISVKGADGRYTRWGPDEADPYMIPFGLKFGDSIPGGFKDGGATLARPLDITFPDLNLLDEVQIYGPGRDIAWEGRMAGFPASWQTDFSIGAQMLGHASQLKDDSSFREIYVDRDLTRWQAASVGRKLGIAATFTINDGQVTPDATGGQPALVTSVVTPWAAAPGRALGESWYDAQGVPIGQLQGAWKKDPNTNGADANWTWKGLLSTDDIDTATDATANLLGAGPGTFSLSATTANRLFAQLQMFYAVADASSNIYHAIAWTVAAVYGRHGLPQQGALTATSAPGFYGHDIAADIFKRAASSLVVAIGAGGVEQDFSFVVPHLTFLDPVDGETAQSTLNAMFQKDWGVWEGKQAFWKSYDQYADVWELRRSEGATIDLAGDQADDVFSGVVVRYQLPDGTNRTAGPTGYAAANVTDPSLLSTDPNNPAITHGIRRWGVLNLSNPATDAGAVQMGRLWLLDKSFPQRRGTATVTGTARHATKGERPAWAIRSGSSVRFMDHSADVYRKVIEKSYDDKTKQATLTLDNTALKLDAILERIGVQLQGLVLGQG